MSENNEQIMTADRMREIITAKCIILPASCNYYTSHRVEIHRASAIEVMTFVHRHFSREAGIRASRLFLVADSKVSRFFLFV